MPSFQLRTHNHKDKTWFTIWISIPGKTAWALYSDGTGKFHGSSSTWYVCYFLFWNGLQALPFMCIALSEWRLFLWWKHYSSVSQSSEMCWSVSWLWFNCSSWMCLILRARRLKHVFFSFCVVVFVILVVSIRYQISKLLLGTIILIIGVTSPGWVSNGTFIM